MLKGSDYSSAVGSSITESRMPNMSAENSTVEPTPVPEPTPTTETKKAESKRITDDDLYRHSSQYRLWSFTKEQLESRRRALNAKVVDKVNEKLQDIISKHNDLSQEELNAINEKAVPVTMEEELKFVNFFAKKVQSFCHSLNLPTEVCATAISFFRRFFLVNSTMEIHPKHILLASIFLACKSENYFIGIEAFAKKTKSQPTTILKYEFDVLESLQFTLLNHHPYRPLHGFFLDIQYILHGKVDLNYMGQIYTNCKRRITETLLTDVVSHYTPPQITLACLLIDDEALTLKYLEVKFGSPPEEQKDSETEGLKTEETPSDTKLPSNLKLQTLTALIRECQAMILNVETLSKEEATKIDAKLHYCQNPMLLVDRMRRQKQQRDSSAELTTEPDSKKLKV